MPFSDTYIQSHSRMQGCSSGESIITNTFQLLGFTLKGRVSYDVIFTQPFYHVQRINIVIIWSFLTSIFIKGNLSFNKFSLIVVHA